MNLEINIMNINEKKNNETVYLQITIFANFGLSISYQ